MVSWFLICKIAFWCNVMEVVTIPTPAAGPSPFSFGAAGWDKDDNGHDGFPTSGWPVVIGGYTIDALIYFYDGSSVNYIEIVGEHLSWPDDLFYSDSLITFNSDTVFDSITYNSGTGITTFSVSPAIVVYVPDTAYNGRFYAGSYQLGASSPLAWLY